MPTFLVDEPLQIALVFNSIIQQNLIDLVRKQVALSFFQDIETFFVLRAGGFLRSFQQIENLLGAFKRFTSKEADTFDLLNRSRVFFRESFVIDFFWIVFGAGFEFSRPLLEFEK